MGRGRHTSSRGRGSEPEGPDEREPSGWHDDERGTEEWLNTAEYAWPVPRTHHEAVPPPTTGDPWPAQQAAGEPRLSAWDAAPSPALPTAWDVEPAPARQAAEEPRLSAWDAEPAPARPSAWDAAPSPVWPSAWGQDPVSARSGGAGDDFPHASATVPEQDLPRAGTGPDPEHDFRRAGAGLDSEPDLLRVGAGPGFEGDLSRVGAGPDLEPDLLRVDLEPQAERDTSRAGHGVGGRRGRGGHDRPKTWRGRRLAALSAAAVVTAVVTAVIGVKLTAGQVNLVTTPDCPKGQVCAAIASGKPPQQDLSPDQTGATDAPSPSGEESAAPASATPGSPARDSAVPTAVPSTGASRPPARRTAAPSTRPTPDRTRTTPTARPAPPSDDTADPTPEPEDTDTTTPETDPLADESDPLIARGRVAVDFGVSEETSAGYTGRLTITNTGSALDGWSVRVPVGGQVTGADGADWTQEGDVLVLSSTGTLGEDEQVVVSFTADGGSAVPDTCELAGGTCRLQAAGDLTSQVEPGR
ncbi:hypothetical protein [Sphaerisporangium dianthi]|uniref:CBM2 domain-containing protein n=1 Tax=Sphaerisporangium dianthi TaxID=1436120 RepID=A0ABV9CLJ6_9ACTN